MKKSLPVAFFSFLACGLLVSTFVPSSAIAVPGITTQPASLPANSKKSAPIDNEEEINRFTNSIVLIKDFYVKPITDNALLENAIRGMVSGLDPHSEYLDPDAFKALMMTTSGEFGGIGIEVTPEYGVLKVVSPMDDTPAYKAGIKSGDYIVAIDTKLVSEMTLRDAVEKMRGKAGSDVSLTILRKGEKAPKTYKLTRQVIRIPSVKSKLIDQTLGYVRITQFQEPTGKMLNQALDDLKKQSNNKLKGVVLDLRNNPGGLLESAVTVANAFLDNKKTDKYKDVIVYTEGRLPEAQFSAKATASPAIGDLPMVVLINGGSASASEIVAGALQDYHRAIIVGTPSFGKGSVQTVLPLDKNHAIKLTTALYHTPAGRVIQNIGIVPDITIEDLKVENNKAADDLAMVEPIKEFQLKNHLTTATTAKNSGEVALGVLATNQDALLAQQDFQLFEAIKILRTIVYAESTNNR